MRGATPGQQIADGAFFPRKASSWSRFFSLEYLVGSRVARSGGGGRPAVGASALWICVRYAVTARLKLRAGAVPVWTLRDGAPPAHMALNVLGVASLAADGGGGVCGSCHGWETRWDGLGDVAWPWLLAVVVLSCWRAGRVVMLVRGRLLLRYTRVVRDRRRGCVSLKREGAALWFGRQKWRQSVIELGFCGYSTAF